MSESVAQTIVELRARALLITQTADALEQIFGKAQTSAVISAPSRNGNGVPHKRDISQGKKGDIISAAVEQIGEGLITAKIVASHIAIGKIASGTISAHLSHLANIGFLERVGFGQYRKKENNVAKEYEKFRATVKTEKEDQDV